MPKPRLAFFAEYPDTPAMRPVMEKELEGASIRLHKKAQAQGRCGILVWKTRTPNINYKEFAQGIKKVLISIEWKDEDTK